MREAKARRDLIGGELAAGRNPTEILRAISAAPVPVTTITRWCDRFLESRIDVDENTIKNYTSSLKKVRARFGDHDPNSLTAAEVAAWVAELATTYKPGTVQQHVVALRLLLDFDRRR